jgi:lipid-A-disaccharide synthase-like uncharacterized protein
MLDTLWQSITGYIHDVFILQFNAWIALGFAAQAMFSMRFLVQWIASERAGRSVVPHAFWLFSVGGGLMLLIYAIHRRDPVIISGQALALIIYSRNLHFIRRERSSAATPAE